VKSSRWVSSTTPGLIWVMVKVCSPSKIPPGPTRPIQRSSRPGETTSTVGVKVVFPVASCMTLVSVAPTRTSPLDATMNGFHSW
jgi:hypothetical protein